MVQRFYVPYMEESCSDWSPNCVIRYEDYQELEAENALRDNDWDLMMAAGDIRDELSAEV